MASGERVQVQRLATDRGCVLLFERWTSGPAEWHAPFRASLCGTALVGVFVEHCLLRLHHRLLPDFFLAGSSDIRLKICRQRSILIVRHLILATVESSI